LIGPVASAPRVRSVFRAGWIRGVLVSVRRTYRMGAFSRVVILSGCPLFVRPKRGRKSRRAGRAAADGPAPRRGRESEGPEGSSRGLARTSALAQTSIREKPLCGAEPSEAPHRERPGERIRWGRRRGQAGGTALVLFDVEKSVDRETVSTCDGQWGRRQRLFVRCFGGGALYAGRVYASPSRPPFAVLSARCVESEPAGAAAVYTSRAVRGRGVSARSCSRRQNERSAPAHFRCRRRKYTGRRAYPRTIRANYTGRRGAEA
jgi:hypothetical protein